MKSWSVKAYAKINLGLRVVRKRPDDYHDIDTRFLQVDLHDTLFFEKEKGNKFELTCNWLQIPCDRSNLCAKAYQALTEKIDKKPGLRLHLEKRIPFGAGLGGGSSDAAVTLIALNRFWGVNLSADVLHELAASLGSDVPFFIKGGFCHGTGRGEILTPLDGLPNFWILLVTPDIVVPTSWVYQKTKLILTKRQKYSTLMGFVPKYRVNDVVIDYDNDLESIVFPAYPELKAISDELIASGAIFVSMSGSGSAIYGLFESFEEAQQSQKKLHSAHTSFIARPVKWGKKEIDEYYASSISG